MEGNKFAMKYEYFRQAGTWQDMAKNVCTWVNTNINTSRLAGITSVECSYDNKNMVNLFYNDGIISKDVLEQTSNLVLTYQIFIYERKQRFSWKKHNEKMLEKIDQIAQRAQIVAINSLEHDKNHTHNLTIVWYKRMK